MLYLINPVNISCHLIAVSNRFGINPCVVWTDAQTKKKYLIGNDFYPKDIQEIYMHNLDDFLKNNHPFGFVPGDDLSLRIADTYQNNFFPNNSNNIDLLDIRCSKILYYEHLKKHAMIITDQVEYNEKTFFNFPCIMKPLISEGTKDTFFVKSKKEAEKIQNEKQNTKFILQTYMSGEEYSVDICAFGDHYKLLGVWKYTKTEGNFFREEIDLIDSSDSTVDRIFNYMIKVLDLLGVKVGHSHSEIILNENSISLVEINFRYHGHLGPGVQKNAIGTTQFIESFLSYTGQKIEGHKKNYYKGIFLKKILINNTREKFLKNIPWYEIDKLKSVATIYKHDFMFNLPNIIKKTVDVSTCLGYVMMQGSNLEEFNKDVEIVRSWKNKITT